MLRMRWSCYLHSSQTEPSDSMLCQDSRRPMMKYTHHYDTSQLIFVMSHFNLKIFCFGRYYFPSENLFIKATTFVSLVSIIILFLFPLQLIIKWWFYHSYLLQHLDIIMLIKAKLNLCWRKYCFECDMGFLVLRICCFTFFNLCKLCVTKLYQVRKRN